MRDYERDKANKLRREEQLEVDWDVNLSFEWLYKLYGGYSVRHINRVRATKGREPIKRVGTYKAWEDNRVPEVAWLI